MKSICIFLSIVLLAAASNAGSLPKVQEVLNCSFNKNRIIIYEFSGSPAINEINAYLAKNRPTYTAGRFTAAYFFKKGSSIPRSGQSLCESISKANEILYESSQINSWDFAFMYDVDGKKVLVNCQTGTKSDLCRQ